MEDTLAARNKMESVRAARRNAPGASSSLEGSLTANYSHHQKEWALQIRALQNRQVCRNEGGWVVGLMDICNGVEVPTNRAVVFYFR